MRPPRKNFTVERIKKRRTAGRTDTDFLGLNRLASASGSAPVREPEPARRANPLADSESIPAILRRTPPADAGVPAGPKPASTRILPDLSQNERRRDERPEEETAPREPRKPRRRTRDWKAPEIKKPRKRAVSQPAEPAPQPVLPAEPAQLPAPVADSGPSSIKPEPKRRVRRQAADPVLSAREMRRAIARGALKPEEKRPFGRGRDPESRPRHWSSLVKAAKRGS